ncbi:hypothetical protein TNCV_1510571 [Trichonephila clavipes]|nr:hypothetical protein TNCV_1510571 [Trichonephila clavipes]
MKQRELDLLTYHGGGGETSSHPLSEFFCRLVAGRHSRRNYISTPTPSSPIHLALGDISCSLKSKSICPLTIDHELASSSS